MWRNSCTKLVNQALKSARFAPSFRSGAGLFANPYCSDVAGSGGGGVGDENVMTYAEAKRLMRLVDVEALKERLGLENKEMISYGELLKACESVGVARTSGEAAAFARVLDEAGVVLLFRDKVYLHPDKVHPHISFHS